VQDVCDRITILFRGRMQTLGHVKDLVQLRNITQLETTGLSPEQLAQAKAFIHQLTGKDPSVTHPSTTLEDLFIRIVNENTPAGQSYTSSR